MNSFRIECNSIEIERFISNKNIITNISRLQAYDSVTSGYFCTEFIDFMFCTEFIDFMLKSKMSIDYITSRAPWCSGYCTTSFNKILTQILHRFKPCLLRVRDLCWGHKCLSSVNHSAKAIITNIFSASEYEKNDNIMQKYLQ